MNAWLRMTMAAALVASVAVLGCGSDEESTAGSGTDSSLSRAEFAKRADAACAEAWEDGLRKGTAYVDRHRSEGVPEEKLNERGLKVAVLAAIEGEVAALRSLGAPDGDEQALDAMLASLEAGYETAKARPANLSLSELGNQLKTDKRFQRYGITQCRY